MDSVSEFLVSDRLNVELVSIDLLDFRGVNGRDIGVRHALLNMMGFSSSIGFSVRLTLLAPKFAYQNT